MEKRMLQTISGREVPCWVSAPDYGEIRRVVLGVHGMGGSAMDDIQVSIAEEMEMFYSAAVRFDFPGHGENPTEGPLELTACTEALMTVAQFAKAQFPEVEDLCIFATGFGAYITLVCLEELLDLPGNIKLVVQTPSVRMHETLLAMKNINRETLWAMDKVSFARLARPIEVTYSFYEQLANNIVLTTHPIPMLILHGEEDSYIRMDDIQQFHRINEDSKLVIIPGTSHRFLEDGAWDMVLDLTRDWFEFEQVLLSDWY